MEEGSHRLWHFHGGLRLPGQKELSTQLPLRSISLPPILILPTQQHVGEAAEVVVKPGDYVHKGQVVARGLSYVSAPVHAPSSGTVVEVCERPIPHPSGLSGLCVVIETDGREEWIPERLEPMPDYTDRPPAELRLRVRESGIVGLGGAAFPAAVKLNPRPDQKIHTLVLNGAECEPYISCDDTLMRERPEEVIAGAQIIRHALGNPRCLIAIEDNMPSSLAAIAKALESSESSELRLVAVPAVYPTGGEQQLIKVLTGKEVPSHGLPLDIGMVCHNVGTAYAIYQAVVHGEPLLSRIVTVTGDGVSQPCNLEVPLGTPVADVIAAAGGYKGNVERLIMGGPMMGFALHSDEVPVTKATNCLLVSGAEEIVRSDPVMPCIRCGECMRVCPAQLLPQELYWHAKSKALDKAQEYNLFDCIECGCCAYVCPSHIPLVQYYRYAKSEIWALEKQRETADLARRRHEYHLERQEREKAQRAARQAKRKAALTGFQSETAESKKAAIQEAVNRAKARKTAIAGDKGGGSESK